MINWTQADVEFIASNIVLPMIKELNNQYMQFFEQHDKITGESIQKVTNAITDKLKEVFYNQQRDRAFCKALFTQALFNQTLLTSELYDDLYKTWCDEYDKLNKK